MFAFLKAKVYSLLSTLTLVLIAFYRAVGSLWLSGSCRFEPSCSIYAEEAVRRYGFWVGGKLAFSRLLRCRPGGPFGLESSAGLRRRSCEKEVLG